MLEYVCTTNTMTSQTTPTALKKVNLTMATAVFYLIVNKEVEISGDMGDLNQLNDEAKGKITDLQIKKSAIIEMFSEQGIINVNHFNKLVKALRNRQISERET